MPRGPARMKKPKPSPSDPLDAVFARLDPVFSGMHHALFGERRLLSSVASAFVYVAIVLFLGPSLSVSANYFVLIPVIVFSLAFGLPGGMVSGFLALPCNLALFAATGHLSYAPASWPIAEISGILVGTTLGYLSDYFRRLEGERVLRMEAEDELRTALNEKEILFRELHHRVKNNLNIIKSLIVLQSGRSHSIEFKNAATELVGRIIAISLIHEQLYRKAEISSVEIMEYLDTLVRAIVLSQGDYAHPPKVAVEGDKRPLPMDIAVPLGIIVNEAVMNAIKHARPSGALEIWICLRAEDFDLLLEISDNGPGFDPSVGGEGLGFQLLDVLARQVGGIVSINSGKGTRIRVRFPAPDSGT